MATPELGNIHLKEGSRRRLGYAQEFRQMIREHPGILKTALKLTQLAEDEYNPPHLHIGVYELEWSKERTQFEVIKQGNEDTSSSREQRPFHELVWGRGAVFVPGGTLRDEDSGLEVTLLGKAKREFRGGTWGVGDVRRIDRSAFFKVQLGDKAFFVKKSVATNNPGYNEFSNSQKAAAVLREVENLGIIEAQLGYEDDHQSWFVSKWEELESEGFFSLDTWRGSIPNDYGKYRHTAIRRTQEEIHRWYEEKLEVMNKGQAKIEQIKNKLAEIGVEIHDLYVNLFYNPETGKYFLLDITITAPGEMPKGIGQPETY